MLLDTSGLMAFFDRHDHRHARARTLFASASSRVTHNYVLAEFVALANARGAPRSQALAFVASLVDNPSVQVVWVDAPLHRRSVAHLQARLDKAWSLCDAVSFLIMRERGIMEALTTDGHFEQAGLVRLLES